MGLNNLPGFFLLDLVSCLWQLSAKDIVFCPVRAENAQKRAFWAECACFKDKGVCISHFNFQGLVCTLQVRGSQNHVLWTKHLGISHMCHRDWLLRKFQGGLCSRDCTLSKAQEGALSGMEINFRCAASEFKYLGTQKRGPFAKCSDFSDHQHDLLFQAIVLKVHTSRGK